LLKKEAKKTFAEFVRGGEIPMAQLKERFSWFSFSNKRLACFAP